MDDKTQAHKEAAVQFLQAVIAGRVDDAYAKYVDMRGQHHNPYFAAGFAALQVGMRENHVQFPHKTLSVKNVIGEGDLVAVHSQVVLSPGGPDVAAVHLFRFNADKIVELWDVGQAVPGDSPNEQGMF